MMTIMRFHFAIRDLLWLTALVAVLVAWWVDYDKTIQQRDRYRIELDKLQRHGGATPLAS